jgi:hypothetical protein
VGPHPRPGLRGEQPAQPPSPQTLVDAPRPDGLPPHHSPFGGVLGVCWWLCLCGVGECDFSL